MKLFPRFLPALLLVGMLSACKQDLGVYEKTMPLPRHQWAASFKPQFQFTIADTTRPYQVFFIIRHTEKYNFNNIYINLTAKLPGSDSLVSRRLDLPLATNDQGWLGTGMDDIYEHRIALGSPENFRKGDYSFTIEQLMREDPLDHVFDVGLRIEKQ